jgi:hypothetical protein
MWCGVELELVDLRLGPESLDVGGERFSVRLEASRCEQVDTERCTPLPSCSDLSGQRVWLLISAGEECDPPPTTPRLLTRPNSDRQPSAQPRPAADYPKGERCSCAQSTLTQWAVSHLDHRSAQPSVLATSPSRTGTVREVRRKPSSAVTVSCGELRSCSLRLLAAT